MRVDVVICTYNHADLLDRTLTAAARVRVPRDVTWSVLVVDNNCTDHTRAVVERHEWAGSLPLHLVTETEQGLTPARRRGVLETTGEWIAFVDDDCLLHPAWLERTVAFAREHPDAGALGGRVVLDYEREPGPVVRRHEWAYAGQDLGEAPARVGCLAGAGMVVRRAALERTGWLDRQLLADRVGEKLVSGGDVELALRLGARHELWYVPDCVLRHIIPAGRLTPAYLEGVVRGLGTSKLLGDSMLWAGGYPAWVRRSARDARWFARQTARTALDAARGRRERLDVTVDLRFLVGYLAGMWRLARMPRADRAALLGCATPG